MAERAKRLELPPLPRVNRLYADAPEPAAAAQPKPKSAPVCQPDTPKRQPKAPKSRRKTKKRKPKKAAAK